MILDFRTSYLFNIFSDIISYIQNYPFEICTRGPLVYARMHNGTVMLVCEHKGVEETPSRIHGNQIIHFLLSHAYHEKRVYGLSNGLNSPKNGLI